jgi:hypothetical protein
MYRHRTVGLCFLEHYFQAWRLVSQRNKSSAFMVSSSEALASYRKMNALQTKFVASSQQIIVVLRSLLDVSQRLERIILYDLFPMPYCMQSLKKEKLHAVQPFRMLHAILATLVSCILGQRHVMMKQEGEAIYQTHSLRITCRQGTVQHKHSNVILFTCNYVHTLITCYESLFSELIYKILRWFRRM